MNPFKVYENTIDPGYNYRSDLKVRGYSDSKPRRCHLCGETFRFGDGFIFVGHRRVHYGNIDCWERQIGGSIGFTKRARKESETKR